MKKYSLIYGFTLSVCSLFIMCNTNIQDVVEVSHDEQSPIAWGTTRYSVVGENGYMKSSKTPSMDYYYVNDIYYLFTARAFNDYSSGISGVEVSCFDGNSYIRREIFGDNIFGDVALCIDRTNNYLQALVKRNATGNKMVHYWRYPTPDGSPIGSGTWIRQYVLNTSCTGTPAFLCNKISPNNFEVVYRDVSGSNLRHLWRESQGGWHEDGTLLPLPANYSVCSDPAIAQTDADGIIHVAAAVHDNSDGSNFLAYWMREAHSVNWNNPCIYRVMDLGSVMKPAIVQANSSKIVIFCRLLDDPKGQISGIANTGNSTFNNPELLFYEKMPMITSKGFHSGCSVLNIGGVGVQAKYSSICSMYLGVTELYNVNSTSTYLISFGASPQ